MVERKTVQYSFKTKLTINNITYDIVIIIDAYLCLDV